jgi:hypothetical protein
LGGDMGDAQGSPSSHRSACRSAGRLGLRGQPTTEERDTRGSQGVIPRHVRPGKSASSQLAPLFSHRVAHATCASAQSSRSGNESRVSLRQYP